MIDACTAAEAISDIDTRADDVQEQLDWLMARRAIQEVGTTDAELDHRIARTEALLAELIVVRMAWCGHQPQLPDLLN